MASKLANRRMVIILLHQCFFPLFFQFFSSCAPSETIIKKKFRVRFHIKKNPEFSCLRKRVELHFVFVMESFCLFVIIKWVMFSFSLKKHWTKERECNSKEKAWLDSLGRLLYGAIGVEGLKLLLNSCQRVGKFPVVQHNDSLLNPSQQVWRQSLILINHLLCLNGLIQNLKEEVNDSEEGRFDKL